MLLVSRHLALLALALPLALADTPTKGAYRAKCDATGVKDKFGCCAFPADGWSVRVKPIPAGSCFEKDDPITVEWEVIPKADAGDAWAERRPFQVATVYPFAGLLVKPKADPQDINAHAIYQYTPAEDVAFCVNEGKATFKLDPGNFDASNPLLAPPYIYPYVPTATYSVGLITVTDTYEEHAQKLAVEPDPRNGPSGQFVLAEDCNKWRQEVGPSRIGQPPQGGKGGAGGEGSGSSGSGGGAGSAPHHKKKKNGGH